MLWTLVVVLLILWLLGALAGPRMGWYGDGIAAPSYIHIVAVVAVILVLYLLLGRGHL